MDPAAYRRARRSLLRSIAMVVALFAFYSFVPLRGPWWWVGAAVGAISLLALLPLTAHRLRAVNASDAPVLEAFEALVLLMTILMTGFAAVYYGMNHAHDQFRGLDSRIDGIYFTVTTLSTVGYGDITAVSQTARVAVTVQMVFDIAYVGIAFRVLTATARRARRGARRDMGDEADDI
jgi:voltage-gated potassium channel